MDRIHFIGRVYPETFKVSVRFPDLQWKWEEGGIEPLFRVVVNQSFVNIECHFDQYRDEYFVEMYRRAVDLARTATNLVAFTTGYGLSVTLETLILPDGSTSTIAPHDPAVSPLCTAYTTEPHRQRDFDAIARLVIVEPALFHALNDLIEIIKTPHTVLVNCGRVLDSICRMTGPSTKGKGPNAQAWRDMQRALNISETYQKWISEQAVGPRHADPAHVRGAVTNEVGRRTWIIMNRFLEYRKRGNQPLVAPDFPHLS